jgi:hypothetical protein
LTLQLAEFSAVSPRTQDTFAPSLQRPLALLQMLQSGVSYAVPVPSAHKTRNWMFLHVLLAQPAGSPWLAWEMLYAKKSALVATIAQSKDSNAL